MTQNKPLRLFQITDTANGNHNEAVNNLYFAEKPQAKQTRQALNAAAKTELRYIVSPGPDHHKFARSFTKCAHPK